MNCVIEHLLLPMKGCDPLQVCQSKPPAAQRRKRKKNQHQPQFHCVDLKRISFLLLQDNNSHSIGFVRPFGWMYCKRARKGYSHLLPSYHVRFLLALVAGRCQFFGMDSNTELVFAALFLLFLCMTDRIEEVYSIFCRRIRTALTITAFIQSSISFALSKEEGAWK